MLGLCFHVDFTLASLFCVEDSFFKVFFLSPKYIFSLLQYVFFKAFSFTLSVDVPEEEKKREKLIGELFQTEETYLDNLKLVYEVS